MSFHVLHLVERERTLRTHVLLLGVRLGGYTITVGMGGGAGALMLEAPIVLLVIRMK